MVTRHSKQMPMPHKAPRGSPESERRACSIPARVSAAHTETPPGTLTLRPLMEISISPGIGNLFEA
jgi:hypothetical protein